VQQGEGGAFGAAPSPEPLTAERYPPEYPRNQDSYDSDERTVGHPKRRAAIKAWADFMRVHAPEQMCTDPVKDAQWRERHRGFKGRSDD
jgi:hypothetical protein